MLVAGSAGLVVTPAAAYVDVREVTARADYEPEMVNAFAQQWGLSLEEATVQLDLQDAMDTIDYPRLDKGYVEILSHPGPGFWIEYRTTENELSPAVADAFAGAGLLELVTVARVPRSVGLLVRAQEALRGVSPVRADTWIDTASGEIVAETLQRPGDEARARVADKLAERLGKEVPVKWREVPALAEPSVGGGLNMNGVRNCTAGFVVRRISGTLLGVSTAGHCPDSMSYSGASMTFLGEYYHGYGDVQWHYSNQLSYQKTFWDGSSQRPATGRKAWVNMNVNDSICKYGRTTGYNCGVVAHRAYCPSYIPSGTCTYLRTNNSAADMSEPGDSGGPNFVGGTAWGLTSGHIEGTNNGIVMPQEFMSYLDIQVAVQ